MCRARFVNRQLKIRGVMCKIKWVLSLLFSLFLMTMSVFADDPNSILKDEIEKIKPAGSINVPEIYNNIENVLKNGADPNTVIDSNKSPSILGRLSRVVGTIKLASSNNLTEHEMVEFLRLLVKYGGNVKAGEDLLSSPVYFGNKEYVQELLQLGVDPNTPSEDDGMLPVDIANAQGHPDVAELLIKFGGKGSSSRDLQQIKFVEAATNHDIDAMNTAIKNGADITSDDIYGKGALVGAIQYSFYSKSVYEAIMYLLNNGADPNHISKTEWGNYSPLGMAMLSTKVWLNKKGGIREDFKDSPAYARLTIEQLIKHGAYVSDKDENGMTPLHIASKWDNLKAAEILIKHGAKINEKDNYGKFPYDYAKSEEMIRLFKSQSINWQFYFIIGILSIVICLIIIILVMLKKR